MKTSRRILAIAAFVALAWTFSPGDSTTASLSSWRDRADADYHQRFIRGPRGPRGPRGTVGPIGAQGPTGPAGAEGPPGKDASALPRASGLFMPEAEEQLVRSQNVAAVEPVEERDGAWCIEPEGIDVDLAVVVATPVAPDVDTMEPIVPLVRWIPNGTLCEEGQLEVETDIIELPGGFPEPADLPFSFVVEG